MSDLYFIKAGHAAVKIGHSANVWQRFVNMQTNNHELLDCLLRLNGRGSEEAVFQRAFAGAHIHGEWYQWTPEVEKAVLSIRAGEPAWWECLFPPDDIIAEWTVDSLDDSEGFEEAYSDCVWNWRTNIANEFYNLRHPDTDRSPLSNLGAVR